MSVERRRCRLFSLREASLALERPPHSLRLVYDV